MLLVQCLNQKDCSILQESFTRQQDYFAVPFKRASVIMDLIGSLKYEYFAQEIENQRKPGRRKGNKEGSKNESKLLKKIIKMAENSLKMKISLVNIREIFELVKELQDKLKTYQCHILKLNSVFMTSSEGEDEEQDHASNSQYSINQLFEQVLQKEKVVKKTAFQQKKEKIEQQSLLDKINNLEIGRTLKSVKSLSSFQSSEDTGRVLRDFSKQVRLPHHESLRIQIPSTPKGFQTSYKKIEEQDILSENCQLMQVTKVSDEVAYDGQTNSTFYCPWKKTEEEKKKMMSSFFASFSDCKQQSSSNHSNQSDFAEDLSGQVRPMPSVLTNQSIHDLVAYDEKQDLKKSHILKESIMGITRTSFQLKDKIYENNLKELKLNQKLNKQAFNRERKRNGFIKTAPTSIHKKSEEKGNNFFEAFKTELNESSPTPKAEKLRQGLFSKFKQVCFGK